MVKMYTVLTFQHIFEHNDHTKSVEQVHNSARTGVFYNLIFGCIYSFHHPRNLLKFEKPRFFKRIVCFFFLCHETKTNEWHKSNKLTQTNQMQRKTPLAFAFSFPLKSISVFCLVFTVLFVSFVCIGKKSNSTYLMRTFEKV